MNVKIIKDTTEREVIAFVESESNEGTFYDVELKDGEWSCTCPQNKFKKIRCKHIKAVEEKE